jgi:hypothetical protein
MQMVEFRTSFSLAMLDVSIPYSGVYFLERNNASKKIVNFVTIVVQ